MDRSSDHWKSSIVMRSESRTPAARCAASKTDVQSGRGPPGSGASIGSRICSAARDERASARVRSCPTEKGRFISGSYAETATRSAFREASSISLLLPTPGSPSTTTALGATAHPDLTEGQIREMIAGADWWREMATSGANAGSAQSAYDE